MEAFDKVEELLLAEGYSKEEIPAIMVSLVEQGMSPTEIVGRGIIDMLNLLPKKRKPEPLPKTKAVADLLPDKLQPKAPKPEFGPNAVKPQPPVKTQPGRPGGITPEPQFRTNQPRTNAGGATSIPRTNATTRPVQPQAPVPKFGTTPATSAVPKGNLFTRLQSLATPQNLVKGIRGVGGALGSLGAQTAGVEIATKLAQTAGTPGQSRMSMFGTSLRGNAPVYNTPLNPNNVPAPQPKSTRPKGMSNIPPAEGMVNNPNYGKPGTVQPKATPTPPTLSTSTPAPPVPKLTTAQQDVNTEYDRLRKSNPAKAVEYGLRMARAGASKSSFKLPK